MKIVKNKEGMKSVKPKRNLIAVISLSLLVLATSGGIYYFLSQLLQQESYYVLNRDIKPKTQITAEMLDEVVTAKGTAPKNAATPAMLNSGAVYSKYALNKGDIVSSSNAGVDLDIGTGVPDEWGYTSFTIQSDNAVGGNVKKGDYFDVLGISPENGAKYIIFNVLALDVNLETTETVTQDGQGISIGKNLHYIVGMPSDKIAEFHHALSKYEEIKIVRSPNIVRYKNRDIKPLGKIFLVDEKTKPVDLFKGTDPTFSTVLRDNNGRPVNKDNCAKNLINPMSLCEKISNLQETSEPTPEPTTEDTTEEITKTTNTTETTQNTSEGTTQNPLETTTQNTTNPVAPSN